MCCSTGPGPASQAKNQGPVSLRLGNLFASSDVKLPVPQPISRMALDLAGCLRRRQLGRQLLGHVRLHNGVPVIGVCGLGEFLSE